MTVIITTTVCFTTAISTIIVNFHYLCYYINEATTTVLTISQSWTHFSSKYIENREQAKVATMKTN